MCAVPRISSCCASLVALTELRPRFGDGSEGEEFGDGFGGEEFGDGFGDEEFGDGFGITA